MNSPRHRMTLTLEVNRIAGGPPTQPMRACFDEAGGSIGRREDNDWVLPDPERFISGRHAMIGFHEDQFYVTDLSSNGLFINHDETALGYEGRAPLRQGDTLTIGEYEIGVSLGESAIQASDNSSFDALDDPYARLLAENAGVALEEALPSLDPVQDGSADQTGFTLDEPAPPDLLIDEPCKPRQPPPATASEPDHVPDLDASFSQPDLIPEDWQGGEERAESVSTAIPLHPTLHPAEAAAKADFGSVPPRPEERTGEAPPDTATRLPSDEAALRDALARGLGLSANLLEDIPLSELLENLGAILRSSVEGAMSMLRARTQVKSEFRMSQTMIRPVENNPLKFSVNAEDALRHVILPRANSGYLSPLAAFQEAHQDTEAHMLAVMVGMQSALKAVILRFEPDHLEQRLRRSALLEKVPLYRRAKSWELFTQLYNEIANEVEDDFQQVFGQAFSQAYEAQIRRLASLRYSNNRLMNQDRN